MVRFHLLNEKKDGYRVKKLDGGLHFVFRGSEHIGNILAPQLGGDKKNASQHTAIAKHWGKKSTHPSKHSAMEWLKNSHGLTVRLESLKEGLTREEIEDLKKHVVPAIKHEGKLYLGKRGQSHQNILDQNRRHNLPKDFSTNNENAGKDMRIDGFYHPGTKKFYSHGDIHQEFDSTGLMTKNQRFRKYNTESLEQEMTILEDTTHIFTNEKGHEARLATTKFKNGDTEYTTHLPKEHKVSGLRTVRHSTFAKADQRLKGLGYKYSGQMNNEGAESQIQGSTPNSRLINRDKRSMVNVVKKDPNKAIDNKTYSSNDVTEAFLRVYNEAKNKNPIGDGDNIKMNDIKLKPDQSTSYQKKKVNTGDSEEIKLPKTDTNQPGPIIQVNPSLNKPYDSPDIGVNDQKKKPATT